MNKSFKVWAVLWALSAVATAVSAQATPSGASGSQLDAVLNISNTSSSERSKIGYAREQTLKEMATAFGARAGLADRSRELIALLDSRAAQLDSRFNFNKLVIGNSVLPAA